MKPLEDVDAGIFFGRDAPIVEAIDRLRGLRSAAPPRLLVILGASGAGKTSFLRAGLLPRLARDDAHFLPLPAIRPEQAALFGENGFLGALEKILPLRTRAELREVIRAGAMGVRPLLAELIDAAFRRTLADAGSAMPPAIVIAVDQAEELFRGAGAEEGAALLSLLRDLVSMDAPTVIALFAIRSDSYNDLEHAKPLEGLAQSTLPLLPMPRGDYKDVIEGPARRCIEAGGRLTIEPQLTESLLGDIEKGGGKDALPLLAFTLEQLYREYGAAGALRLADYENFGGIQGAIERSVERALKAADNDPRIPRDRTVRLALLRRGLIPWLAGIDPESKSPRRNIARRADIPEEARPLIDLLVEERLLSTDVERVKDAKTGAETRGAVTIEPTHEALLRQWGLLKGWLADDFGLLATLEGVERGARDWDANARAPAWLTHQSQRLAEARALDARPDIAARLDSTDRAYLAQCAAREDAARAEAEQRRREREEEQARRLADAEALAAANKRIARRTQIGLIAALILAAAAGMFGFEAMWQWKVAQDETNRAIATREDAAEVARLARRKLANTNVQLGDRLDNLIDWTPPAWRAKLYHWRAATYATAGDFPEQRRNLDKALRIEPGLVPLLISSSDNFVAIGDADGAVRDARKALDAGATDALVYGNLILGEAMQRNFSGAIADIGQALTKSQRMIDSTESLGAPDVQEFTSGFKLSVRDTDFLLALRYEKAALFAMSGDHRFADALDEADRADRDRPFSRAAYLAALNWEWLILRGQAIRDAREAEGRDTPAPAAKLPIRDYGAYAIEGALWARIAATRGNFADRAAGAFAKFRETYKAAPREDYRGLAAWVEQEAGKSVERPDEPKSPLDMARDLEVRATELGNGPNSGTDPWRMAPALKQLSDAIHLLDPQSLGRPLGRQEEDALIDLLLRRGDWKLSAKDNGGAAQDARRVLDIDERIAEAHRLLGEALVASADKRREYNRAIELDPGNTDALSGLASIEEETSPKEALDLLDRERTFIRFQAKGYARLARLQDRVGLFGDALRNIGKAIELAPWSFAYYSARRDYEIHAKADPNTNVADLHSAQGLHEIAEFSARTGDDAAALRAFTEAFREAADLPEDPAVTFELGSLTRDFSAFLVRRFGRADAEQWWRSFAANPLASDREKQLSAGEAQRVAVER